MLYPVYAVGLLPVFHYTAMLYHRRHSVSLHPCACVLVSYRFTLVEGPCVRSGYPYEIKHHRVQHMQDALPHKQFIFVHKNRKDKKKCRIFLECQQIPVEMLLKEQGANSILNSAQTVRLGLQNRIGNVLYFHRDCCPSAHWLYDVCQIWCSALWFTLKWLISLPYVVNEMLKSWPCRAPFFLIL